jgi:hypothetical protein
VVYPPAVFTEDELATLRENGIAIFRGKLILEAQPPITDAQLAEIEARLTSPVPSGLRELWRTAFGGSLEYDLEVAFGEHRYQASFRELFYPESDGYRDLFGWMDHELELGAEAAEEGGKPPPDTLPVIPFGGFEYLERFYVSLREGEVGKVVVWAQGLPPAWKMTLNADSIAVVADDIDDLFNQLSLAEDPFAEGANPDLNGIQMAEAHDEVAAKHPALAEKLRAAIRASIFDWRAILGSGPFAKRPVQLRAARVALVHAADNDDVAVIQSLLAADYPVDMVVQGDATVLALALARGGHRVAEALLASDAPLGDAAIIYAKGAKAPLVEKLIARGCEFDVEAVLSVAETGDLAAARHILERGRRRGDFGDVRSAVLKRAEQEADSARRVTSGALSSYLSAADHQARAERLRSLAKELE